MKKKSLLQLTVRKTTIATINGGALQGNAQPINTGGSIGNPQPVNTAGCYTNQICPIAPDTNHTLAPIPEEPIIMSVDFCYP